MFGKLNNVPDKPGRFIPVSKQGGLNDTHIITFVDKFTLVQYTVVHYHHADLSNMSAMTPILNADGKPLLYDHPLPDEDQ